MFSNRPPYDQPLACHRRKSCARLRSALKQPAASTHNRATNKMPDTSVQRRMSMGNRSIAYCLTLTAAVCFELLHIDETIRPSELIWLQAIPFPPAYVRKPARVEGRFEPSPARALRPALWARR